MKRALFLLGFCSALLLPAGAWADIAEPGAPRRPRVLPPVERPLAEASVQNGTGGLRLVFWLAGTGECEYTLRGPQSGDDPGPVVAKGHRATEGDAPLAVEPETAPPRVQPRVQLVEMVAIEPAPEENVTGRYRLEALCRVTPVEQTSFGAKETGQAKEVRFTHTFDLRRESVYRVTPVQQ